MAVTMKRPDTFGAYDELRETLNVYAANQETAAVVRRHEDDMAELRRAAGELDAQSLKIERDASLMPKDRKQARIALGERVFKRIAETEKGVSQFYEQRIADAESKLVDSVDPKRGEEIRRAFEKMDSLQLKAVVTELDDETFSALVTAPKRPTVDKWGVPKLTPWLDAETVQSEHRRRRPEIAAHIDEMRASLGAFRGLANHARQIAGKRLEAWGAAPVEFQYRKR